MSVHQRHFILLVVVVAIIASSSRHCFADPTVRDKTAVSLQNTDDQTPTSHTKSIDAQDEERAGSPLANVASVASTDARLPPLLTKSKSISQSASKPSIWRRLFGKSKSKKMQQGIARAEEFVEKNPKAVETVMNNPSVREAAKKHIWYDDFSRGMIKVFGVKGQRRYVYSRLVFIIALILIVIISCIF